MIYNIDFYFLISQMNIVQRHLSLHTYIKYFASIYESDLAKNWDHYATSLLRLNATCVAPFNSDSKHLNVCIFNVNIFFMNYYKHSMTYVKQNNKRH